MSGLQLYCFTMRAHSDLRHARLPVARPGTLFALIVDCDVNAAATRAEAILGLMPYAKNGPCQPQPLSWLTGYPYIEENVKAAQHSGFCFWFQLDDIGEPIPPVINSPVWRASARVTPGPLHPRGKEWDFGFLTIWLPQLHRKNAEILHFLLHAYLPYQVVPPLAMALDEGERPQFWQQHERAAITQGMSIFFEFAPVTMTADAFAKLPAKKQ